MNEARTCTALKVSGTSGAAVLFLKLDHLYPECSFLIKDAQQLHPLFCLAHDGCPRNQSCMDKLAHRVKYIFDTFADVTALILYFKWPDRPGSHRGGIFTREWHEPRLITFNRSGWEKLKAVGTVYQWVIPDSVFLRVSPTSEALVTLRTL